MKNIILKVITSIVDIIALLSALALDDKTYLAGGILILCMIYLSIFAYANGYMKGIE